MAKQTSIKPKKVATKAAVKPGAAKHTLLAGGNPRIAKAAADAVQAYIGAMPGSKNDVGRRIDALVIRTIPGVRKAIKWNSPLYGIEGYGWFLGIHCFTGYVKVVFFRGRGHWPSGSARRPPSCSRMIIWLAC
jgi:hypothetical protein